jgi:hypothetical protein
LTRRPERVAPKKKYPRDRERIDHFASWHCSA